MAGLRVLIEDRDEHLAQADRILKSAEETKRPLSALDSVQVEKHMQAVAELNTKIENVRKQNTIFNYVENGAIVSGGNKGQSFTKAAPRKAFSESYGAEWLEYIQTNGKKIGAALYEGTDSSGGFAVPVVVDGQIVPLAPAEMAVRRISMVIPTTSDIKFPTKASFGTSAAKAETESFAGTPPTLGQFTLSAFMAGAADDVSWELAQDVPSFSAFTVDDLILSQQMYEENLYVNGSGSGEAQGLIGNVGVGVAAGEADSNSLNPNLDGVLDLIGSLKGMYHDNASFLMTRATSIILRKDQVKSNLFEPAWTTQGAKNYLFGYPVEFSSSMPAATAGETPILFGDFRRGYLIGDRGGSGINVKVLDQPKALQGLITLLAYRRTDGRVRIAEAIQSYTLALS